MGVEDVFYKSAISCYSFQEKDIVRSDRFSGLTSAP